MSKRQGIILVVCVWNNKSGGDFTVKYYRKKRINAVSARTANPLPDRFFADA